MWDGSLRSNAGRKSSPFIIILYTNSHTHKQNPSQNLWKSRMRDGFGLSGQLLNPLSDCNFLRDRLHFRRTHAVINRLKRFSESQHFVLSHSGGLNFNLSLSLTPNPALTCARNLLLLIRHIRCFWYWRLLSCVVLQQNWLQNFPENTVRDWVFGLEFLLLHC